jgi:hypothetical protein
MIASKSDFVDLYNRGLLGNKLRQWRHLVDVRKAGYAGTLSIRDGRPSSNLSRYRVPVAEANAAVAEMLGAGARDIYYNESAPDDVLLFQGEYLHGVPAGNPAGSVRNHYLMWSRERVPMKRVRKWAHTEGAATLWLLRSSLSPGAWDQFEDIRERFPDHTIEFSVYDRLLGNCPGCNWVVWEVRGY